MGDPLVVGNGAGCAGLQLPTRIVMTVGDGLGELENILCELCVLDDPLREA